MIADALFLHSATSSARECQSVHRAFSIGTIKDIMRGTMRGHFCNGDGGGDEVKINWRISYVGRVGMRELVKFSVSREIGAWAWELNDG